MKMSSDAPRMFRAGATSKHLGARIVLGCLTAALALGVATPACTTKPEAGELGTLRFAGRARGGAPLNLIPPVSDRSGNIYILYGGLNVPETEVFVGRVGGGWTGGCSLTKGDKYGVHGWVGFDEETQWYWSGDALVSVSGSSADCHRVLDRDPGTDVNLFFRAVLPWVRDAATRTTTIAFVQSPLDPAPFTAVVDLQAEILTNVREFEPADATQVTIIGVGADRETNLGFVLLQYARAGSFVVEGRFYDADAKLVATNRIRTDALPPYGVLGYLQTGSDGLVAGVLDGNRLVTFDQSGGRVREIEGMTAVGVHRWEGSLYVVGKTDDRPVVAKLDASGNLGSPQTWNASLATAEALRGPQEVRDDRSLPSRMTTWTKVTTAIGDFPFVHPHSPIEHSEGSTLSLFAGPSFDTGGARITAFAVAPVGITYP